MSDTAILNRAGWGKPQNIARGRSPEGYREEWTYVARRDGSMRTLQFVNGRLAGMNLDAGVAVAAQPPAVLTTTAATAKPAVNAQRPTATAVAAVSEVSAPARQGDGVQSAVESGGERASEAAKVLENAGVVREMGRPSVSASTLASSLASSSQPDGKRIPAVEPNAERSTLGGSHDAIVMVNTP